MDNQNNNNNALVNGDNQFTMPKVIDYLQNEWLKFEVDRAHWVSEKAELTNRILKLESERKLFESHKFDLCRRVKMLEYALQQERLKNNSLLQQKVEEKVEDDEEDKIPKGREPPKKSKDNTTRLIIRKYLREMGYNDLIVSKSLQTDFENDSLKIDDDATDTINGTNDTTVKTILNLKDINNNINNNSNNNNNSNSNNKNQTTTTTITTTSPSTSNKTESTTTTTTTEATTNGNVFNNNTIIASPTTSTTSTSTSTSTLTLTSTSTSSTSQPQQLQSSLSELINNSTDLTQSLDSLSSSSGYEYDSLLDNLKQLDNSSVSSNGSGSNSINSSSDSLDTSKQSQEDLNNVTISKQQQQESDEQSFNSFNEDIFNKLTANSKGRMKIKGLGNLKNFKKEHMGEDGGLSLPDQNTEEKSTTTTTTAPSSTSTGSMRKKKSSSSSNSSGSSNSNTMNSELMGLGASDLNDITLDDGSKTGNDSAAPRVWKFKHSLKSHFDGVRSIQFHPSEPIMMSASEDSSIKIWNLNHLVPTKKSPSPEIEPLYTIRGHIGPVFASEWNQINGEFSNYQSFFSAGYDMIIRQWSLPSSDIDSYYQHGKILPYLEKEFIGGHQDGIWDLLSIPNTPNLLSSSSDGTVSLWNTANGEQLYSLQHSGGLSYIPTSITLPATENNRKLLTSYNDGSILLFDLETQQIISQLKQGGGSNSQINKIVSHPFMSLAITGSEDHKIEFFDLNSNAVVHSMIAHSNSISSLTIDPSGLYIASCAHDSSIRFWDISSKTCIQDLNSHRPKYDESIHCIKYHPNKGYFASGGADSVIRILN
ncbi:hypothetical protein RB653_008470 [Dictyostelium firmibasis]|uniref:Striatin N-terminal domain-containing protein n=1 Tax=Dictyostelium firmibasis TaxID=79012 RepID=A0AAN7YWM0_9MYCE